MQTSVVETTVPDDTPLPQALRRRDADSIDRRVAARLSSRRRALGIDPSWLEAAIGVREGTIVRLETGESRIGAGQLFRLAQVLGVEVDWFFAEDPEDAILEAALNAAQNGEEPKDVVEARRFLALYRRLPNAGVQEQVREIVRALAESAAYARPETRPAADREELA